MIILAKLLEYITEFIVIPAKGSSGIVLRHTEFNMVACIVETTCNVDSAITVRIKNVLILRHERLGKVGTTLT